MGFIFCGDEERFMYYRVRSSLLPCHAITYAQEDGILSPEAIDLWGSFLEGVPQPWSPEVQGAFLELIDSSYAVRTINYSNRGRWDGVDIHDTPVSGNYAYWGPTPVQRQKEYRREAESRTESDRREGFKQALGGVYVMTNAKFKAVKIGISGHGSMPNRIGDHRTHGWELGKTFEFEDMKAARSVEQGILRHFWAKGFTSPVTPLDMPQGGSTEVFRLKDVSLSQMIEEIEART